MDLLELEALLIRNRVVRPLLERKEVDCWTALAMVVAPSSELEDASLKAAVRQGISDETKFLRGGSIDDAVKRIDVVTIEDLAAV